MLSYAFLLATSKAILTQSKAIQGRVFMAPFLASELASPNLQQVIADTVAGIEHKRYPLSLMLPPVQSGELQHEGKWNDYNVQQLFIKQENRDSGGNTQQLNLLTNQGQHTILQDWHDMARVANNYIRALDTLRSNDPMGFGSKMRLSDANRQRIVPITRLSNDVLNGVLLTYTVSLFEDCAIEDYNPGWEAAVQLPTGDQHPVHPL